MNYKKRIFETHIKELSKAFKIVFLVGARQVGKSTLFAHLFPDVKTVVFDPVQDMYNARQDPDLFLRNFQSPLILDEVQYAPELLPALKRMVDQSDNKGQYFLTGSQQLSIMKSVSESLAGRVALVEIDPMTIHELYGSYSQSNNWLSKYLDDPYTLQKNFVGIIPNMPPLFEVLWRGGMPGTIELPQQLMGTYFSSYVQTYVERDVRLLENIQDVTTFGRFFALLGALTAQEMNHSQLGRDIGISPLTAQRWLQLLVHTYQWHEVMPYHGNAIKRISGKSKGFFTDTGMACYLQRISSPTALAASPILGAIFETFCFATIKALCGNLTSQPKMYHWRSIAGAEVDLLLELDGKLYPIEIKCKTQLTKHDARGIQAFAQTYQGQSIMPGIIMYAGSECYMVTDDVIAVPWNAI